MAKPIRILVIDDSAFNRQTITAMLEGSADFQVVGRAADGEEGLKQAFSLQPDVITLDLEMPVMDGFAFLRWLMANLPTAVIVVSSRSSDRSVFKALDLGAVDFIAKPGGRVSPRLEEIQRDLLALPSVGMLILEISHRSAAFESILAQADRRPRLRQLGQRQRPHDIPKVIREHMELETDGVGSEGIA